MTQHSASVPNVTLPWIQSAAKLDQTPSPTKSALLWIKDAAPPSFEQQEIRIFPLHSFETRLLHLGCAYFTDLLNFYVLCTSVDFT